MPIPTLRRAALAAGLLLAPAPALAAQAPAAGGLDPADLDTTCRACENFYRFANGGWIDRNPVPAARSVWSGYDEARERTRGVLRTLLDEAAAHAAAGTGEPTARKVGTLYAACMDSAGRTARGAAPLRPYLARIAAVRDRAGLQDEIARLQGDDVGVLWYFYAGTDPRAARRTTASLWQGGLSLPSRDHYLDDDSATRALRARFAGDVAAMLVLAGEDAASAAAQARAVLALETELARASMTPEETRDPQATYNRMTAAELGRRMPHWDWPRYMAAFGVPASEPVIVGQPGVLEAVDRLVAERPLEEWRAYLRWRVVSDAAPYLSPAFEGARFRMGAALTGARAPLPRWERCMGTVESAMGQALGRMYMERVFTPESRRRGLEIIANLKAVLRERLAGLEWMGEETRREAIAKLDSMAGYVGGPDRWRDYGPLEVRPGEVLENVVRATRFLLREEWARLGRPADRAGWYQMAHSYSGAYSFEENKLVYPAGKFQPPFFDPLADDAVNYGALGSTIGHEIVHGFDDSGRQYDATGALRDWWTPEDDRRFRERADRLVAQYDAYTVLDTVHVNGRFTLGENIADLGGVTLSYHAFQRSLRGKPRETIGGFTPEQRFFLAWARNWRWSIRPEALRLRIKTDEHAPMPYRLIGSLSNLPEFAAAFGCKPGDRMVRSEEERVRIW
ncbi:MAG TPA: M13 family metallopeptidase [Longimicrobium sp.]|nr:M13 family metallopeptidase [Longimicrobium sp.]